LYKTNFIALLLDYIHFSVCQRIWAISLKKGFKTGPQVQQESIIRSDTVIPFFAKGFGGQALMAHSP